MAYINDSTWDRYTNIINSFHDDANKQIVIWEKMLSARTRLSNDVIRSNVTLEGLIQYNFFRNWPINKAEVAGEVDKQSLLLYLNLEYLRGLDLLNDNNQFIFDPVYDRFTIEGVRYKAMGDSKAAQAKDKTLLFFIILQREEVLTQDAPR